MVKNYALEKAAEVVTLIETMAENKEIMIDPKVVKNKVLDNICARNKNRSVVKNKEFWSLNLLHKLGLMPAIKLGDTDEEESDQV